MQRPPWGDGEEAFRLPASLEWGSAGSPWALRDEREAQEETGGLRVRNGVESKAGALQALRPRLARQAEGPLMVSAGPSSPKSLRRGLVDGRRDLIKTLGNYLVTSPTTLTT